MGEIPKSRHKDAITAHFNALKRQSIEIKEWEMTIYYGALSPRQRDELDKLECGENEMLLQTMIRHAKEEDGSPCFTDADLGWLARESAAAIIRMVGLRILTADLVDIKSLGKPSAPKTEP